MLLSLLRPTTLICWSIRNFCTGGTPTCFFYPPPRLGLAKGARRVPTLKMNVLPLAHILSQFPSCNSPKMRAGLHTTIVASTQLVSPPWHVFSRGFFSPTFQRKHSTPISRCELEHGPTWKLRSAGKSVEHASNFFRDWIVATSPIYLREIIDEDSIARESRSRRWAAVAPTPLAIRGVDCASPVGRVVPEGGRTREPGT